jgi:Type IX secretion system membrane protein PorP/SprF
LVFLVGLSSDKVQVGYSFDYTVSKLSLSSSGGTHEVSMTYLLCGKRKGKKKKLIVVSCPKF